MRNLKALGLAALMALAGSAMFASGAQAQEGTLTVGETPATHEAAEIVGEQYPDPEIEEDDPNWNFFASTPEEEEKIRCDTANLTGSTATGTETKLAVEAEYIHCTAGGQPATVHMNGCEYILTRPSTIAEDEYTGKTDLTCPEENRIEVDVYLFGNITEDTDIFHLCTIEVWPENGHEQELGGHVIYKNNSEGPKDDITAQVTVEGITSFDGCVSGEHHDNGIYKQTLTIEAFNGNGQRDLWISD